MRLIPVFVGVPLVVLIQFIVFLFCVIASPLGQLLFHRSRQCYTYWGYKEVCSRRRYTSRGVAAFGCKGRRNAMNAAAAFSIISIVFTLILFLLLGLIALKSQVLAICLNLFALLNVGVTLIPWACVASVRQQRMCFGDRYGTFTRYGPGFGLQLTAWCLQFINFLLICCVGYYGSRRKCDPCCNPCCQQPCVNTMPCEPVCTTQCAELPPYYTQQAYEVAINTASQAPIQTPEQAPQACEVAINTASQAPIQTPEQAPHESAVHEESHSFIQQTSEQLPISVNEPVAEAQDQPITMPTIEEIQKQLSQQV